MGKFRYVILFVVSVGYGQYQDKIHYKSADATIVPNGLEKKIKGSITYTFEVLADVDSIFIDAKNMAFSSVLLDQQPWKHTVGKKRIVIHKPFKKGNTHSLILDFSAQPKQAVYFFGWEDGKRSNAQIWTQGQGKYSSHWIPSFDEMAQKVIFDLNIVADAGFSVIANGVLTTKSVKGSDKILWGFDMKKPMSSYLLAFVIGDYQKQSLVSSNGIPILNYYYPKDSLLVEPTYRYSKEIFDFLENEIGVSYPWQNYKQVPVRDFLYAGMENTGATLFSDAYVIDSIAFIDQNYITINAHEMAHQWFGNLVTELNGDHHWLHEGFATYYALLAERKIFGDMHYYWKLYDTAMQLSKQTEVGNGEALTNPRASSLTFYEKGAWALVMLRDHVGDRAFKAGVKNYLSKYAFKNATIDNFLEEVAHSSGVNLAEFRKLWLENPEFPKSTATSYLSTNAQEIGTLLKIENQLTKRPEEFRTAVEIPWNNFTPEVKNRLIHAYREHFTASVLERILKHGTPKVRQAVVMTTNKIPTELQSAFEGLLKDKSYRTLEHTLMGLWVAFPEKRFDYLDQTKSITGLPNKNVRLLWLTLAIVTDGYQSEKRQDFFSELVSYTSSNHAWEIRMGAFQYLAQALGLNDLALTNYLKQLVTLVGNLKSMHVIC